MKSSSGNLRYNTPRHELSYTRHFSNCNQIRVIDIPTIIKAALLIDIDI